MSAACGSGTSEPRSRPTRRLCARNSRRDQASRPSAATRKRRRTLRRPGAAPGVRGALRPNPTAARAHPAPPFPPVQAATAPTSPTRTPPSRSLPSAPPPSRASRRTLRFPRPPPPSPRGVQVLLARRPQRHGRPGAIGRARPRISPISSPPLPLWRRRYGTCTPWRTPNHQI